MKKRTQSLTATGLSRVVSTPPHQDSLSLQTDSVRVMKHRVFSLTITFFEGENTPTVVSQLRSAISRLTFLKELPREIVLKLLDVFQSSSVPHFNDVFRFCDLQYKIKHKSPSYQDLLVLVYILHLS